MASSDYGVSEPEKEQANRGQGEEDAAAAARDEAIAKRAARRRCWR